MDAGAFEAARTGRTQIAELGNIFLARRINQILDGAFAAPWEIEQIPDEILDAVLAVDGVGEMAKGISQVESFFANWRANYGRK